MRACVCAVGVWFWGRAAESVRPHMCMGESVRLRPCREKTASRHAPCMYTHTHNPPHTHTQTHTHMSTRAFVCVNQDARPRHRGLMHCNMLQLTATQECTKTERPRHQTEAQCTQPSRSTARPHYNGLRKNSLKHNTAQNCIIINTAQP